MSRSIAAFAALVLFSLPLLAQEKEKTDTEVKSIGQIEQLNTVAEIEKAFKKFGPTIPAEAAAFREKYGEDIDETTLPPYINKYTEYAAACGERILKIAKDDAEKLTGYKILLGGWQQLAVKEQWLYGNKLAKEAGFSDEDIKRKNTKKTMGFRLKAQAYETAAAKKMNEIYAGIEKEGKFPDFVKKYRDRMFLYKVTAFGVDFTPEGFAQVKEAAVREINRGCTVGTMAFLFSIFDKPKVDAELEEKMTKELAAFVTSDECTLPAEQKKKWLSRLNWAERRGIGADLKLYGKTLDDKDFDWDALRGKIVLVNFTATWCGPCKREIPGMLEAYKKYRDKGFEIVSVYIRDKLDAVKTAAEKEQLPWIIISEELTKAAGSTLFPQQGQGEFYGIAGIPTMPLVGKDGKVLAIDISGEALQTKLAELFGN
ncbi:MAG: TlpA family protein disulfide reductase [Planctomycetaceae bacterium]|jgi:thiol-disulfide isomerase/thioredoxin|nr:TlpA family protein disulfide reductase [Planctomycetaceae bacterium]